MRVVACLLLTCLCPDAPRAAPAADIDAKGAEEFGGRRRIAKGVSGDGSQVSSAACRSRLSRALRYRAKTPRRHASSCGTTTQVGFESRGRRR